jgi:hypothetical protein
MIHRTTSEVSRISGFPPKNGRASLTKTENPTTIPATVIPRPCRRPTRNA